MMTDERRAWLRGAYLDRIMETAQAYAAGHSHFADSEWESFIAAEFEYLTELSAEDHAYLREQAGLEAWKRIRDDNIARRKEVFGLIRSDHPDVFSGDIELFAFDSGWGDLVRHAAERLETYPEEWRARIMGGKEKFGALVLWCQYDTKQRGARSEIERLREEVRLRSLATCEICGSSGRLRLSAFAKTVCDKHAAVMGEFRDDDGMHADPWKWNEERRLEDYIDDVIGKGRALIADVQAGLIGDEYPAESADVLKDLAPVRPRPTDHVTDTDAEFFPSPLRATPIGQRIDDDTWSKVGREQEMLIEFGFHILDSVQGACVKVEYLDGYIRDEIAQWREFAAQPLTESDEEFLRGYLRELIDAEYERVRLKQNADRNNE
ncbi:hypothetical protein ABIA25_002876 [Sinorhizobium fredii]|uniref:hypothetical protein n=1 Tax=Rhizobium fredii TaxID=380 RepID=UPI003515ECF1